MSDWQPIETAPKDGTAILVWDGVSVRVVTYMHDDEHGEAVWFPDGMPFVRASHWMPLPAPPGGEQ